MNIKFRHIIIVCITVLLNCIPFQSASAITDPEMIDYTAYPPFTVNVVEPNILLVLDVSGSMQYPAYLGCDPLALDDKNAAYDNKRVDCQSSNDTIDPAYAYDADREDGDYYGYFKTDKYYKYASNKYEENGTCYDTDNKIGKADCISGNLLNWATMSRVDVMRKALIGGKAASTQGNTHTLRGEGGWREYSDSDLGCTFTLDGGSAANLDHSLTITDYVCGGCPATCQVGNVSNTNVKVDLPENERRGIVHRLSDKDYDGTWDADSPRFGLMIFGGNDREGLMQVGIEGANMSSFLTAVQSAGPYGATPTGEALVETRDYFKQVDENTHETNNAYIGGPGSTKDPMCDNGTKIVCRKNFVLLVTDGDWTSGGAAIDPVIPAHYNFITNIRSDDLPDDFVNIMTYAVYAFGDTAAGENSTKQVALFGSYEDFDSNGWPYNRTEEPADSKIPTMPADPCDPDGTMDNQCKEWDQDIIPDGIPDNYYDASEGSDLESKLIEAITDMLRRAASGTAVSVLATSGEGEGAVYQAYFLPELLEGVEKRRWLGYIQALFVDKFGNLREDTNENDKLDITPALDGTTDKILLMSYNAVDGTKVYKCSDDNGDGTIDSCPVTPDDFDSLKAIWRGGEALWNADPADRTIFTTADGYTYLDFIEANSTDLKPLLRASDTDATEVTNIIKWIRGDDLTDIDDDNHAGGYRKRSVTIPPITGSTKTWKLGDIINSTPVTVAKPAENFDLVYNDHTYSNFRRAYLKRRQVVYVGSNDGMLHAFNAGCYDSNDDQFYPDVDGNGNCQSGGSRSVGDELWAFIPRTLLPHLKWLTDPDYTHVYYVDLQPYVTDAKLFNDIIHTDGWGTILIGGLRYGGKNISWTAGGTDYYRYPEYFALDITNPLDPRVLWSFSDPDIGLSMSKPTLVKIGTDWFAIFGSGATDFNTGSNLTTYQDGNIFVLKISGGNNGVVSTWTEGTNFWKIPTSYTTTFMADPITLDIDSDFNDDVVYIGENYQQGGGWNALMRRITTGNGTQSDPSSWTLSTFADVDDIDGNTDLDIARKITSAPSASMDNRGNVWVFFGTGQFLGTSDKNQTDTGGFYAIKDGCWEGNCTTAYSNLLDVSITSVNTDGNVVGVSGACTNGATSTWTSLLTGSYACDGWSIFFQTRGEIFDFTGADLNRDGERVISTPLILGGLVTWTTYTPGIEECAFEGDSNLYSVYYKTGTSFKKYVFKEQKEQAAPDSKVARVKHLGKGMPSSVSAQITDSGTVKGFAQQSTGSIAEIEQDPAFKMKSGRTGWIEDKVQ